MFRTLIVFVPLVLAISCETTAGDVRLSDAEALACPAQPSSESCQVYTCVELDRQCGDKGYPQLYGKHYCQKFLGRCDNTLFTEAEKKWATATIQCLQASTFEAQHLGDACQTIESKGFEAHDHCFTDAATEFDAPSFCSLGPASWRRIRACVDGDDRLSRLGVEQMAQTLLACGEKLGQGLFDQDSSVDVPDTTVLNEWANEAQTLGQKWLNEVRDR